MVNRAPTAILFPPSPIPPYIPKISFLMHPLPLPGVPGRCCASPPRSVLSRSHRHLCPPPLRLLRGRPCQSHPALPGLHPSDRILPETILISTNRIPSIPKCHRRYTDTDTARSVPQHVRVGRVGWRGHRPRLRS
jgi:hypothetical protein